MFQPVCPAVGRRPAGVCAEGSECVGRPQRQRQEGRPDRTDFCSFTENGSTTATAQVQSEYTHSYTS